MKRNVVFSICFTLAFLVLLSSAGYAFTSVPAQSIVLSPDNAITLTVGQVFTLKAAVTPSNATNKMLKWSSGNSKIASVDAKGAVKALAAGKADITVKTMDGKVSAKCTVSIPDNKALYPAGSKVAVKYGSDFGIEFLESGIKKVVDGDDRTLLLVPRGQQIPAKYKDMKDVTVVRTPVQRVLYASLTQVCFLRPLKTLWDSVAGVTSPKEEWYIDEVKQGLDKGGITYVGNSSKPDFEKIQALKPDIAFVYTGTSAQTELIQKLKELKIPYAVDNEYMEQEGLGRMEWLKFIATFYDRDQEAQQYFDAADARVQEMKKKVASEAAPKVSWGLVYSGKVYVPQAGSYVAKMIKDAGGDYVFSDFGVNKGGSVAIGVEEYVSKAKDADIMIYSSYPANIPSIDAFVQGTPVMKELKAVKTEKLWSFQPWYYQALDKTDETMIDLAAIFHPSLYKGYELKDYVKVPAK